ncbi:hypothetical protein [Streptomyces sp. NPDC047976]
MSDGVREHVLGRTPRGRLVGFLCSPQGQWINGQLLKSDGGFTA